MRHLALSSAILGALLALNIGSAQAQATRTWVSGVGDDANPCSRTAPCKTFAGAISKTAPAGEINCLDPAGYGALTITKSIAINCEYTLGSVLVSGTNGIIVNVGVNDTVTLRGLEFEGLGTGISGIAFIGAGVLHVEKVNVRKFLGSGSGISFTPNGVAELYVIDSIIQDSGATTGNANIKIAPTNAGANVTALIENTQANNGSFNGIVVNGNTASSLKVTIKNSSIAGNPIGLQSTSSSNNVNLMLDGVVIANGVTGLSVTNGNTRIGNSTITGNGTGVTFSAGSLTSYKNNRIDDNSTNGTPIPQVNFN